MQCLLADWLADWENDMRKRIASKLHLLSVRGVESVTLARAARDYHERVIVPTRTDEHGAQWLSSLENHVPAAIWHKPIGQVRPPQRCRRWPRYDPTIARAISTPAIALPRRCSAFGSV